MRHRPTPAPSLWRGLRHALPFAIAAYLILWWAIRYYHSFH